MPHLFAQDFSRSGCLREVVDTRRTAALVGPLHFNQFEARDGSEQPARRLPDALAVRQMTGILIGHAQGQRIQWRHQTQRVQPFRDVTNPLRQFPGAGVIFAARRKQPRIFLQRRAAPRGVGHDGVTGNRQKRVQHPSRQRTCHIAKACMHGQGSATPLPGRDDHLAAVGLQDPQRRFIERGECQLRDAPGEQGHTCPAPSLRGKDEAVAREEKLTVHRWKEVQGQGAGGLSRPPGNASGKARAFDSAQPSGQRRHAPWIGQQVAIEELACEAPAQRPAKLLLDACPRLLDQLAVFHAGRADRFTGPAVQAPVNVPHEARIRMAATVFDLKHLLDAAAGRIGLLPPESIGGAVVQTEAAVHAAGIVLPGKLFLLCVNGR